MINEKEFAMERFGPILPYIENKDITDVDINGNELWITDVNNVRTKVEDVEITDEFVANLTRWIGNLMSKNLNKTDVLLEAETEVLRISIIHEEVAITGRSICIRKTPALVRLTEETAIETKFCTEEILHFMANCVKAKFNIAFCGEPGVGKTESAKFFSQYIPKDRRVITIEDNLEWHYKTINPGSDCIELQVDANKFTYTNAIKACLRQNPKYIMLSEARSAEVKYLLECFSTGIRGFTTLHTDDVRKIPDRILNMMENRYDSDRLENDVYRYINIGVLVNIKKNEDGKNIRYIDQIAFFDRADKVNSTYLLYNEGERTDVELPKNILHSFERAGIQHPFGK